MRNYKLSNESSRRQSARGRYNPATVLTFKHGTRKYLAELRCGSGDDLDYWYASGTLYVVSSNSRLGYAGVTLYTLTDTVDEFNDKYFVADMSGEVFAQNSEELDSLLELRNALERLTLRTIGRRLAELIN